MTTIDKPKFMSRFYIKALVFLGVLTMLLVMYESAAAGRNRGRDKLDCESGEPVGYIGIQGLAFKGTFSINTDENTQRWYFKNEPKIESIDPDGPAAGILKKGDVIVEIDGMLITTRKAGKRFGNIDPGEKIVLKIRRDDRLIDKTITAKSVCPEDNPLDLGSTSLADLNVKLEHLSEALEEMSELEIEIPEMPEMPEMIHLEDLASLAELEHFEELAEIGDIHFWPRAWYGMGVSCDKCTINASKDDEPAQWQFEDPPRVHSVDEDGPADKAGIREGDVLTHIEGVRIDTREGGKLFSNTEPGKTMEWTIDRDGESKTVKMETLERPPRVEPRSPRRTYFYHDGAFKLRFSGEVAGADVEVRGTPAVKVTHDEENGVIVVVTPEAKIKIRVADKKK